MKQIYLISTISTHRILYAVATDKNVDDPNVKADIENSLPAHSDFTQDWIGEHIEGIEPMNKDQFIKHFDHLFPDCVDMPVEEKLMSIEDLDTWVPPEKDVI